jgi:hypothetical protein
MQALASNISLNDYYAKENCFLFSHRNKLVALATENRVIVHCLSYKKQSFCSVVERTKYLLMMQK